MPNSTISLQNRIDYISTIGDLAPVIPTGGFTNLLATQIANDVMTEMLSEPFNWKFNRIILAPFYLISWQQDYPSVNTKTIGWLEHACAVDINNTQLPKPLRWLECKRDLERTSEQYGEPKKLCWLPNDQLIEATWAMWPGANKILTNPLGAIQTPSNPFLNMIDANGNILKVTTYGTTGNSAPAAPAASVAGVTVSDGSVVWTVCDPKAQGIRVAPLPPQQGVVWEMHVVAQARPTRFANPQQVLDPLPDDYAAYFTDGLIAYMYRHSSAPLVRARFSEMRQLWRESLMQALRQGDREQDDTGLIPDRGIMQGGPAIHPGPAWPYRPDRW